MKLSLIVAMAMNRTIGLNNQMPWHLSADLKNFKKITMGQPIIMGRKTFESIGRPLPGRQNIIISRNPHYQQQGCSVFNDLDSALQSCTSSAEVFVIGGATLYEATLSRADRLYVTEIQKEFNGDTWFPEINKEQWQEISREDINDDSSVDFNYSFIILDR
ncbi:dihydrofolate reductase [Bathymodiolus platifrons methanotrophic gill symbiont]|uniref:type 3 dihydrofolate reductase n=1 Tax=Bathymodiolus platifrons methanotrophic gill symbiont TaxID=113268 RepID=UPI000B4119E2|nr:type 3 dihydrofolate reductase [Bathymodiolus platifrons methanotrophic gill symbiont]MCK5869192.1 type 3 dihydrofolate reductase [Methyloprofundus sp.]TXK92903.1 dihydrofolate reductase [Methylococcaceae bacterium HT1]TXK95966.1 dihydrofolate reductase [Methylococcaceae bacterium CS5]TXK96066.1 dihydrofolate reductase [Methylococcaceae bacterium CS4]TXL05659.1 dihydrofolate reductase [Methylococcaceae bacterium CS1]TXL06199.1 dihydrofolate reductase [Methylococcaceae bacterium CS3]TXL103